MRPILRRMMFYSTGGPAVPSPSISGAGSGTLTVSWPSVSGATSYNLRWGTDGSTYPNVANGVVSGYTITTAAAIVYAEVQAVGTNGFLSSYSSPASGVPFAAYSTFDGPNGTNITSYTPNVGSAWTTTSANFVLSGNKLTNTVDTTLSVAIQNIGASDVTQTMTVNSFFSGTRASVAYFVFRHSDASNLYKMEFFNNSVTLYKTQGGSTTVIATASVTTTTGVDYVLQLRSSGTTITAYVNGVQLLQATGQTFNQTATNFGLAILNQLSPASFCTFDNYEVTIP